MSGMKTILFLILAHVPLAAAATGLPHSPIERVRIFATCAGRLSALEEQQRLFDGAASDRTARQKTIFDSLIAATLPDARAHGLAGRAALHWQVDAKMAQAALLQTAVFGGDQARTVRARRLADGYLAGCRRLILGA